MEEKINKLMVVTARIDEKLDHFQSEQDRHRKQIESLNKRWWTSMGAFTIAIGSLIKSFFTH